MRLRVFRKREPITTSASPFMIGTTSAGISAGSCCASPSRHTTTLGSSVLAYAKPAFSAAALPALASSLSTVAPAASASSAVRSVEPSSTTTTSSAKGRVWNTTLAMKRSSLKAGMTTTTPSSVVLGGAAFSADIDAAAAWPPFPVRRSYSIRPPVERRTGTLLPGCRPAV